MAGRRDRRRRRGENWPNQFEVEPLSVYRQKEGQRTVDLIQSAWKQKGLPPLPTHGAASPLAAAEKRVFGRLKDTAGTNTRPGVSQGAAELYGGARGTLSRPEPPKMPIGKAPAPPGNPILGGLGRAAGGVADIARGDFREGAGDIVGGGWRALAGNEPGSEAADLWKMLGQANNLVVGGTLGPFGQLEYDPATGQPRRRYGLDTVLRGLKNKGRDVVTGGRAGIEEQNREQKLYERYGIDTANPFAAIERQGQEFGAAEEIPIGARVGAQALLDPTSWIGVGAVERLGGEALRTSMRGRLLANLIENPGAATLGGAAGAGAAAQFGEDIPGFNKLPPIAQIMAGGVVGGMTPGAVVGAPGTIRGIPEAVQRAKERARTLRLPDLMEPAPTAGITGTPVWPDVVANQQQEAFRRTETIDPATELPTGPNRGARGPVGPPLSQAETEIDRVLETYRNPDTGELEMSVDDIAAAYTAASPKGKKKPGSLPWMSAEDIRLAFEVGMKGSNWYRTFATWLNDLTGGKLEESLFDFAVGSQQAKPSVNMIKAFNAMRLVNDLTQGGTVPIESIPDFEAQLIAAIGKGTKQGMSTDQVEKIAEGYTTGRSGTTSPGAAKTPYYNQSLIAAFMNKFMPGAVVDTHMGKPLAFGNSKRGGREGFGGSAQPKGDYEYQFANRLFQHLASEYGINVGQFQAGAWETIKKVAEDPELVRAINAGEIEWGEAFARTPDSRATGGFQESFHDDKKVKAAYAALMDSFQKFPPVGERDIQFGFDNPKQSARDTGFSVGPEQTARIQEAVRQKSPILNFSAKPGGTPNLPMDSWTAGQKAFLSSIGYDPATRQFKPLADAGIPHEVELEGFGTWGEDIAAPEPNVRVRLPGANARKAEFVADWLNRELEAAGAKQDAIAIGLPNSQVNTFRGMRIPARAGQFAGPEADNLAAVSSKYGLWPTQSHDGEFIEFNDYRFPGVGKEQYAGGADSFLTRVDLALDELGYSREWVQAHAGDSYLVSAGKDPAGNALPYGDIVARDAGLFDPDDVLSRTNAATGGSTAQPAAAQNGPGSPAQVPVPSKGKSKVARARALLAKGLPEPEMPGVIRRIEPTEDLYHGAMNGWNPAWGIRGSTTGEIGPGLYTTTEAGQGARGRGLAEGYARNEAFTSGSPEEAMDPTLVTLRTKGDEGADLLSTDEPVLPEEIARIREVMPDDVRASFDEGLMENASPDGSISFNKLVRAFRPVSDLVDGDRIPRTTTEYGQMRKYLSEAGIRGLSSDMERQTQQAWFNPNDDLDITNLERLKPEGPPRDFTVSEKAKRRQQILRLQEQLSDVRGRPGREAEESRLRAMLRTLFEEDQATVGVAPRRQRMAGGGRLGTDPRRMAADEISEVLGYDPEFADGLREMLRLERAKQLDPDTLRRLTAIKRTLTQEYGQRFGGIDPDTGEFKPANPVRIYKPGTRAENYRGINEAATARGLDPDADTANVLGAYRDKGDAFDDELLIPAPHERVEGYEPSKPSATEAAARQAEDVASGEMPAPRIEKRQRSYEELISERRRVQTAIDRIEARRTAANADQMGKRLAPLEEELAGIETELRAQEAGPGAGTPGGIAGGQSIARGLADAYAPFRSPVGIAARFGAAYGAAKLEGEDNETALEQAIMAAGVGVAARAGLRAASRSANVARAWEGAENIPPRWGNAKTPEELRKRTEERMARIENLAKGRATQAEQRAAGTAKPRKAPSRKVQADLDAAAEEMGVPKLGPATPRGRWAEPTEAAPGLRPSGPGNRLRPSQTIADQIAKLEEERVPLEAGPGDVLRGAEPSDGADWRDVGPVPKSVQELRDDPLRRLGEQRAIEQQQGVDVLSPGARVRPAATFPEGPESAATSPLGGAFEPAAIEGAGPVDVANPLPRSTPEEEMRVAQELSRVTEARRRVEQEHAEALRMETQPAQGITGEPTDLPDRQQTAEETIAALPADDPRREILERWGEEFRALETKNPKEGITSGNWANKLLIEFPTAMSRMMFSLATSGDFGSGFIQSQLLFFTDPVEWKRSMTRSIHAWGSSEFREKQRAFNRSRIEAAVPEDLKGTIYEHAINGRTITNKDGSTTTGPRLAISTKASEMSGDFGSPILERGKYNPTRPYLQAFRRQFETQTEHLRVHAFTEMLEMARQLNIKQGKGDILFPHQIDGAINKANHLTGATSGRLNPVLGVAFGAPRFLLSQFAMIQDFVTPGGGTSSAYARRKMIQGFGTVMTATVAANLLTSGGKDWFGPGLGGPDDIKNDDDFKRLMTHPNFGRIRVSIPKLGQADVSLFGPLDPMARAFFKEMANLDNILRTGDESVMPGTAGANFLENKASAFPRTILNLASGENRFTGREMDSWQDVIAVEAPRVAPIFTQNFEEALNNEGSWTNVIVGYTGHKSSPLSPSEQVDAVMAGLPDKYWVVDAESKDFRPPENIWELSAKDRSEIRTEYPAVARYLEKIEQDSDKPFSQKLSGVHKEIQQRWDDKLAQGNGYTTADWREQFIANQRQLRETRELEDPIEEREATTQRDLDLDAYFGIFDKPEVAGEDGSTDYSAAESEIRALRSRIGEARWADIEETLGWNESPTVRSYLGDMRNYGDFMDTNPKYKGIPPERTRRADAIATKVREVQASAPGTPSKYILGIWRDQGDITEEEFADATIAIKRSYSDEYEEWKQTEEGVRALRWFKPVDMTQDFVVPEGTTFSDGGSNPYGSSSSREGRRGRRRGRRGRRSREAA